MKFAYLAATAFCLVAASAAGAQTTTKPVVAAAATPAVAPKPVSAPVVAPVVSPVFAPAPAAASAPVPLAVPVVPPAPVVASDPIETWVRKMITHHRSAIAMAETMMNSAQDRQAANLAKGTYYREQRDVVTLQAWLKRHGKSAQ
ncbi:MAG: DUF305 domain-containing protein [Novosphingobium sp.]